MRALLAVAAALLLAGCAAKTTVKGAAVELQPQGFKELRIQLGKGQTVTYSWSTTDDAPVHFDLHQHEGGGTQEFKVVTAATGGDTFTAPADGSYYWFWQNTGNGTTTMDYHVETKGKVTGEYQ